MASDRKVTNSLKTGTNWGGGVIAAVVSVWVFANAGINSVSVASDLARRGVRFDAAEPWIWEFSSALSLLIWLWPVLVLDDAVRARLRSGWARLAVYSGASVVFSIAHVATMVAMRQLAYRFAGWHYDFGSWPDGLLYEYRKDVLSFAAIVVIAAAWRRLMRRAPGVAVPTEATPAPAAAAPTFMVRTSTHGDLLVRADEVDWVEAQGNYVALHVGGEVRLLRHTLADMEARLKGHGFIRTHRRALVNRLHMRAIIPPELGELGVRLSSGQVAPLSESRRAEVVRLALGA
jgi:hypothetical protein